ncbi:hypothetical protein NMS_2389 [Nonlabens marinus S1-08]|uniref:Uncharacterized protein n=1 Tax=Nonlabens marinus S1-08 TaxID=1454201 RepID=W8VWJ6_9FLAO|nr:hypothetical protein NMS_2389 [Nonlabens marinus S1-08]
MFISQDKAHPTSLRWAFFYAVKSSLSRKRTTLQNQYLI